MKHSFIEEGPDELSNRFSNTFIAHAQGGLFVPTYVRHITETNRKAGTISISGIMVDKDLMDWVPIQKVFPGDELEFFPPAPGLRNMKTSALFYDIVPVRHRYRGLRREQIKCTYFDGRAEQKENFLESAEFQYRLFNPQYYGVDTALALVTKKKNTSCAFSKNFAVMRHKGYKHTVFVYKRYAVALYSKNDNAAILPMGAHHLEEELSNFIACVKDKK